MEFELSRSGSGVLLPSAAWQLHVRDARHRDDGHGQGDQEHQIAAVPGSRRQQASAQAHQDAAAVDERRLESGDPLSLPHREIVRDQAHAVGEISAHADAQDAAQHHQVPEARVGDQGQRPGQRHQEQPGHDDVLLGHEPPADGEGGRDGDERRDEARQGHGGLDRREGPFRERLMDPVDRGRERQIRHLEQRHEKDAPYEELLVCGLRQQDHPFPSVFCDRSGVTVRLPDGRHPSGCRVLPSSGIP